MLILAMPSDHTERSNHWHDHCFHFPTDKLGGRIRIFTYFLKALNICRWKAIVHNTICGWLAEREPVFKKGWKKHWENSSLCFTESNLVAHTEWQRIGHLHPAQSVSWMHQVAFQLCFSQIQATHTGFYIPTVICQWLFTHSGPL